MDNRSSESTGEEFRERQADIFGRFLNSAKNIEALRGQTIEQIFGDETNTRTFIANLKPEEFIDLVNGVNGILRGKEKQDRQMDGESVNVEGNLLPDEYTPPRKEDKPELFAEILAAAQKMTAEERSMEDIALAVSATVNATHAYADANGRTSRFVYTLLTKGYSEEGKPALRDVLAEDGRDKVDINPSFIRTEIEEVLLYAPLHDEQTNPLKIHGVFPDRARNEYKFKEAIAESERDKFLDIRNTDTDYFRIAVFQYIYEHPNPEKYIETFPKDDTDQTKKRRVVVMSLLTPDLDHGAIQDITKKYWELKKRYVEKILDSIANPDKPEYQLESEGSKQRIIDLFKSEVQKHSAVR